MNGPAHDFKIRTDRRTVFNYQHVEYIFFFKYDMLFIEYISVSDPDRSGFFRRSGLQKPRSGSVRFFAFNIVTI